MVKSEFRPTEELNVLTQKSYRVDFFRISCDNVDILSRFIVFFQEKSASRVSMFGFAALR